MNLSAEADSFLEAKAGAQWKKVKRTIAFVAAVKSPPPPREDEVPEVEPEEYPGAIFSVLQDICETAVPFPSPIPRFATRITVSLVLFDLVSRRGGVLARLTPQRTCEQGFAFAEM